MSRRHVLGELYSRCEAVVSVPVYLNDAGGEMLGYVDQGLGHYADAFSFHIPDDICRKLSAGYFTFSFDVSYADGVPGRSRRVKLNSISLIARQNYSKPGAGVTLSDEPRTPESKSRAL